MKYMHAFMYIFISEIYDKLRENIDETVDWYNFHFHFHLKSSKETQQQSLTYEISFVRRGSPYVMDIKDADYQIRNVWIYVILTDVLAYVSI